MTPMDIAEEEQFWEQARDKMGTPSASEDIQRESERLSPSLDDGLEPEDWSDAL